MRGGEASRQNGRKGGRPKGAKSRSTLDKLALTEAERLDKIAARETTRQIITAVLRPLIEAQIAHAMGLKYLVVRDKRTGKFLRVTQAMARQKAEQLKDSEEIIEVWEKDPSVQAFTDLLNRALDKPAEQVKLTGDEGGPIEHVFRWRS